MTPLPPVQQPQSKTQVHRDSPQPGTTPKPEVRLPAPHAQHTAVVGLQWGDEGKGKIVDILTRDHDFTVRYNGGANAGHTVVIGREKYALHLIPSGILTEGNVGVLGNGVVVDPEQVIKEKSALEARGVDVSPARLRISDRAHVVMPWHKSLDAALEHLLAGGSGDDKVDRSIGTTKRGIGPSYADKITRASAIRMGDLTDPAFLAERIRVVATIKNAQLLAFDPASEPVDVHELMARFTEIGRQLAPYICDTTYLLHDAMRQGKRLLFEGANACLLDVDHGTFPYVTSSNCSSLGIPAGTGVPGCNIQRVIGIMKAYTTRVGAGPFPTEQANSVGNYIRERGREYGTTTGRPRRCGWLDLVAVRYSAMLSGATSLAVMLFDVIAGLDELRVCTRYRMRMPDGKIVETDRFQPDAHRLESVEPVYETLPGFPEEVTGARALEDLPGPAREYLDLIERDVQLPIEFISVGPERSQTIRCAGSASSGSS